MEFLEKLRALPEGQKKLILWTIVITLALVLFIWWIKNTREKLGSFRGEELRDRFQPPQIPKIEMPLIGLPEISEKDLEQLESELSEEELEELKKLLEDGEQR